MAMFNADLLHVAVLLIGLYLEDTFNVSRDHTMSVF